MIAPPIWILGRTRCVLFHMNLRQGDGIGINDKSFYKSQTDWSNSPLLHTKRWNQVCHIHQAKFSIETQPKVWTWSIREIEPRPSPTRSLCRFVHPAATHKDDKVISWTVTKGITINSGSHMCICCKFWWWDTRCVYQPVCSRDRCVSGSLVRGRDRCVSGSLVRGHICTVGTLALVSNEWTKAKNEAANAKDFEVICWSQDTNTIYLPDELRDL